ncbi:MAG: hypothetical protein LBF49_03865 [Puniceicoccales bacterium]|jgi:hypothetical protein|nr:hypothetical protein [Puniceicoccales bacterium]
MMQKKANYLFHIKDNHRAVSECFAKWPGTEQIPEVKTVLEKSGKETHSLLHGICSMSEKDTSPVPLLCLWRNYRNMKNNLRAVRREISKRFAIKPSRSVTEHSRGHGRRKVRPLRPMAVPGRLAKWPGTEQIAEVKTVLEKSGKETHSLLHGICSMSERDTSPAPLPCLWRNHRNMKNNRPRQRDVAPGKDQSTIRRGTSPQTMAAMHNLIIFLSHSLGTSLVDFICLCSRSHSIPPNPLMEN